MGEFVRLQKYISMCGEASRRAAEKLMIEGKVYVNDKQVRELGTKVEIGADKVKVNGRLIKPETKKYYIMLNKPSGYVTTVRDQFERPTVIDLINEEIHSRIYPVGRLDYETEGLLIMTNDGEFSNKIMHPKYNKNKTYIAVLSGGISISSLNRLRCGIVIDNYKTKPALIEIIESVPGKTTVKITIHEGRNRQIRKMFEAVGSNVIYLKRIAIGDIELGNLPLGRWRYLTAVEISKLAKM